LEKISNSALTNEKFKLEGETSLFNIPIQIHLLFHDKTFQMHQRNIVTYQIKRQKGRFKNSKVRNSLLSQYTIDYFHVRKPLPIQNFDLSWFLFQHNQNAKTRIWRNASHFYNCYPQVDDVASKGLSQFNHSLMTKCQKYAYNCVIGNDFACEQMFFNYAFYVANILKQNKDIFVVRTKQFYDDWDNINKILMQEHNITNNTDSNNHAE